MLRFLPFALFLIMASLLLLSLRGEAPSISDNKTLAAFSIPVLMPQNAAVLTEKSLQGQPAVIHFFASWCSSCLAEHDTLMQLSKRSPFPIYGIAWKDAPENTIGWLKTHGNPYAVVASDPKGKAIISFGATGTPETYVLDSSGNILFSHAGPLTQEMLDKKLLPLLSGIANAS